MTPLNMYIFPFLWYALLLGAVVYTTLETGHLPDLRALGALPLWLGLLTAFIVWMSNRMKRVGIADGHLVVSNYFREERIPFKQVEAVEGVWWYWRRLVRIRFGPPSGFGRTVYYIPPWASLQALFHNPADELRMLMKEHQSLEKWNVS
ncbi:MAG: hypothetical protein ACLPPV_18535 [Candidatus Korobacteraceae bacterium]